MLLRHVEFVQHELAKVFSPEEEQMTRRYEGQLAPSARTTAGTYTIETVEVDAGPGHCLDYMTTFENGPELLTRGRIVSVEQEDGTFVEVEVVPGSSTLTPPMSVYEALEFYGAGKHLESPAWEGPPFVSPNEFYNPRAMEDQLSGAA